MKEIGKIQFEKAERELKKQAEELANKVKCPNCGKEVWDTSNPDQKLNKCWDCKTRFDNPEIEADLKDFSLTDNGAYLSVAHPAMQGATIGVVSKNEYAKNSHEALLRSVLENKFAEYVSTHSLKIIGSFIEPEIKIEAKHGFCDECGESFPHTAYPKDLCDKCEEKHTKKASQEKPIEPAKEITSDLPLLRSADSFRQNVETVAFRNQDKLNRFVASATNGLVDHLRSLRYDMPKVNEVDASKLTENGDSFNGFITASVSLQNSTGPKYLNLPITISASKVVYPNEKETADFVSKGIDLRSKLEEKLALETLTAMAKVDAEESWVKENISNIISEKTAEIKKYASDYTDGVSSTGPGSHIKLQKHLLPGELADWEVGSNIYSDGKKWKLVSKGDGVDSNDKNADSASLWDFVECLPEEGDEKVKADIPR